MPVAVSRVPTMAPVESTTTQPSIGSASPAAAPVASRAAGSVASRADIGASGRSCPSWCAESGPLVPSATAPSVVVSLWSMVLSWIPVAIASADTSWCDLPPWSVMPATRSRREQVGADGGVDGGHDVGVQRHGEVDRRGAVDREVDVGGEVQDRDDLLVRKGGHPLGAQLLDGHRCELVGAHGFPSLARALPAARADCPGAGVRAGRPSMSCPPGPGRSRCYGSNTHRQRGQTPATRKPRFSVETRATAQLGTFGPRNPARCTRRWITRSRWVGCET